MDTTDLIQMQIGDASGSKSAPSNRPIVKGSIVKYKDGWVRVTAKYATCVNLGAVFGGKVYHKRVPLAEVVEDEANWYEAWTKSETYMSM